MKIYFTSITFNDSPVIWELDEKTHQATCTFTCLNESSDTRVKRTASLVMLNKLEEIPGVFSTEDTVMIKDVRLFKEKFILLSEPKPSSEKYDRTSFFKRTFSVSRLRLPITRIIEDVSQPSTDRTHTRKRSSTTETNHPRNFAQIALDNLIINNESESTLWGDTVSYEQYFERKTKEDKKSRTASYLQTTMSFNIMIQYEKNRVLYPLKSKVITAIRKFLDALDPVYTQWCQQDTFHFDKKMVFRYFQDAVLKAMLNAQFNNKPTEFDEMSKQKPNLKLLQYAEQEARVLRAKLMLMKFHVLINDSLLPDLALTEKEAKKLLPALNSLRQFILQQSPEFKEELHLRLQAIADFIIQSGIVEISNKELSEQLNRDLAMKKPIIHQFHSFQSLFALTLPEKYSQKKDLIPTIIAKATEATINRIADSFEDTALMGQNIARLTPQMDNNFYLCPIWAAELREIIGSIILKHPTDAKKVDQYCLQVAEKVTEYITARLHDLTIDNSPDARVFSSTVLK